VLSEKEIESVCRVKKINGTGGSKIRAGKKKGSGQKKISIVQTKFEQGGLLELEAP